MTTHDHQILDKARQFCDYQERCIHDVKEKLQSWQIVPEQVERIIVALQEENYLDEDRYVRAFALGKLRHNKWGKIKISFALKGKGIENALISEALNTIDDGEYEELLASILKTKLVGLKYEFEYEKQGKLFRFAQSRGFENNVIEKALRSINH